LFDFFSFQIFYRFFLLELFCSFCWQTSPLYFVEKGFPPLVDIFILPLDFGFLHPDFFPFLLFFTHSFPFVLLA